MSALVTKALILVPKPTKTKNKENFSFTSLVNVDAKIAK